MTVTTRKTASTSSTSRKLEKKDWFIIAGASLVILAGGGYALYLYFKGKKEQNASYYGSSATSGKKPSGGGSSSGSSSGFKCTSTGYPLKYGTCHPDVGVVQTFLKKVHKAELGTFGKNKDGVDEKFGQVTRQAALKYLKKESFTQQEVSLMKTALKTAS